MHFAKIDFLICSILQHVHFYHQVGSCERPRGLIYRNHLPVSCFLTGACVIVIKISIIHPIWPATLCYLCLGRSYHAFEVTRNKYVELQSSINLTVYAKSQNLPLPIFQARSHARWTPRTRPHSSSWQPTRTLSPN